MKKLLIITFLLCTLFQTNGFCHKKKKRHSKTTITQTNKIRTDSSKSDLLVVSFISFGPGIDYRSIPVFEKDVKQFNSDNACRILYELKQWGREGERDYCIHSNDKQCLEKFTSFIQTAFKGNDRILIKEHTPCRN